MPDILIRGMEMPKHCIDCPCMVDKYGGDNCCLQSEESNEKITSWDDMKAGCPLVELPEHGDLIDRVAFRAEMDNHYPFGRGTQRMHGEADAAKSTIINMLATAPVVVQASKEDAE